jgi:pSer/pThr/pTyr-binding forkhead associated (FHA) protein
VSDLGSTNGTFVNGKKLDRDQLARVGDLIRVGETELQVQP